MNSLLVSVMDDDDFLNGFCSGCSAATSELGFNWCPAGFDPAESDCVRRHVWLDIRELLAATEEEIEAKIA